MTSHERRYVWHDPFEALDRSEGLSPLEYLRAVVDGELPQAPIMDTLGCRLAEVAPGHAVFEGTPAAWHYNPIGSVHAGFALTLLDSAMGCAYITTTTVPTRWATLELKGHLTRPITVETGVVRCFGSVVHPGRRVVTTEGRVEDSAGRLLAHGTSTILVLDA